MTEESLHILAITSSNHTFRILKYCILGLKKMLNRKATKYEVSEIKKLWNEVFGDSDDYINRFITHFGVKNCYVSKKNKEIVAIAFTIPTTFSINEVQDSKIQKFKDLKIQRLLYLYACATHPDYRGQGVMKSLLATVYKNACDEDYTGIFLYAANQFLANYYRKLGFEDCFFRNHSFYYNRKEYKGSTKNTKNELSLRSLRLNIIPPELYQKKRVRILNNSCFINWNEDFFRFLNQTGIQFCEYENSIFSFRTGFNNIIVDELLGKISHNKLASLLSEHLPEFEVIHIRSMGNDFCSGQIKWCNDFKNPDKSGWFAFAME